MIIREDFLPGAGMAVLMSRREAFMVPVALNAFLALAVLANGATEEPRSGAEIYQQALRSTAWVKVYQDNKLRNTGTGLLVDRFRKLLVTNQHVDGGQELVQVGV